MSESTPPPETILGLDPRALLGGVARGRVQPAHGGQLGDYEIVRRIAQGGMGTVYEARQISLGRTVALKLITGGILAGEEEVRRFHREAEAAASLDHPGIVPIYDTGEGDGQHFFSMKLVEGGNLAELNAAVSVEERSRPAWARRAATLVAKMARALQHAHSRGVLHRDIKPTNILLDDDGAPLLTDFGLARLADQVS